VLTRSKLPSEKDCVTIFTEDEQLWR